MDKYATLHGIIVQGDRIGRTIGFPTANLQTAGPLPEDGVYAAVMQWKGGRFYGMLDIGLRPTMDGKDRRVEMHLLDFNGILYGETVAITPLHFLRGNRKFADTGALRAQLALDRQLICHYLEEKGFIQKKGGHA